jgi:hypothetical protein
LTASDSDRQPQPPRGRPTDAELTDLVAGLTKPLTDLLGVLGPAAVSLVRALLDEAYQRGRNDGIEAARARIVTSPPADRPKMAVRA